MVIRINHGLEHTQAQLLFLPRLVRDLEVVFLVLKGARNLY